MQDLLYLVDVSFWFSHWNSRIKSQVHIVKNLGLVLFVMKSDLRFSFFCHGFLILFSALTQNVLSFVL